MRVVRPHFRDRRFGNVRTGKTRRLSDDRPDDPCQQKAQYSHATLNSSGQMKMVANPDCVVRETRVGANVLLSKLVKYHIPFGLGQRSQKKMRRFIFSLMKSYVYSSIAGHWRLKKLNGR
jgi:hypothetical protein